MKITMLTMMLTIIKKNNVVFAGNKASELPTN